MRCREQIEFASKLAKNFEMTDWFNNLNPTTQTVLYAAIKVAVAFGVFGYVLAIGALQFLPETHGKELVPVE